MLNQLQVLLCTAIDLQRSQMLRREAEDEAAAEEELLGNRQETADELSIHPSPDVLSAL